MLSVEEYEKRLESGEQYAPVTSNVGSLLSVYDTMDFQQKQTTSDKALNFGKSVYNGFMSVPRGVLRGAQWLRDVNEAQLNADHPERMQMDEGARQLLDNAADAEFLQPYEVRADSSAERFAYDLAQGAGQLGGQIAVGLATGGYGSLPAMALQIGGEEYKELRDQGIDVETAGKAAAFNAAVQTPLEYIGFSKITKAFPANSLFKQRLRHVAEDAFTEGITEYLQEYPEQISKIWAENADKSPEEIAQIIWDKLGNIHSSATYSGTIGAILGTGAGGLHLAIDHKLDRSIERAMQREAYTEMTEHVESTVNRIKETGINPQYAAAVVNDNTKNQTVYVDGEALDGYAQEKGAEKVAESLGVAVEEIEKAAADGSTVDVKLGNFEATCAAFDGFFQEVKDGTAFEDGGYTPKKEQAEQEQIKRDRERYAELRDKFKAEEDRIISEFTAAGVGKQLAVGQVELLKRFAENLNPDYALSIMQNYKVRRGENGEVQAGYGQFAGENAETADKVKLAEAQKMESEGKAADEIYKATGWFKGLDNRWRFEIPDNLNDIDVSGLEKLGEMQLARVYYNEALLDAYPQLREVKIKVDDNLGEKTSGETSWEKRIIRLNRSELNDKNEAAKTIVHEVQHLIQDIEEHAAGGSPKGIKGFLRAHIKALTKVSKEMQKANPSFARLTKAIDGLGKAAKAQAENPRSKAERDAVSAAFQELKEAREELSAEDKEKLEPLAWRIRELTRAVNSQAKAYDLYRRLGGEQEAREAENRAEDREQLRQDAEATRQYLNDAAQQASGAEQKTLAKLLELRDKFFGDDTLTDEQYDDLIEQMEELKEDLGEELFDKYEQYEEADEAYRTYEEDVMPQPHKQDAIIIFNGVELPYKQKQEESPAGDILLAEKFFVERASNPEALARINDTMQLEDIRERLLNEENTAISNFADYYEKSIGTANETNAYEALRALVETIDDERRSFNNDEVINALAEVLRGKIRIREGSNLEKDLSGDYIRRAGNDEKKNAGSVLIPGEYRRIEEKTPERKALFAKMREEIRAQREKERREQAQQQNNRQAKSRSKESGFFDAIKATLWQTSTQLDTNYPNWLKDQTTATGQHSTQITSTKKTYAKIGDYLKSNGMEDATILDASSGLGFGTQELRQQGFNVEDVEPYPSEKREAPTYTNYADIFKQYDVVISNAVLNVIPDDWRANVLHSMADATKVGGRMIINVRDAQEIIKSKQKIELDSPSEVLITDAKGEKIRAYQKGFTQKELVEWVQKELGDGWTVENATKSNSGLSGARAVVAIKNKESFYAQERKGGFNPYNNVVTMFKGADASTVIHETWHFFVEQMWNMVESGNASEQTVKDFDTLLSYAGMTREEWAAADLDGRRKAHEKLAEAGETYIMEGKSPSYELRRVFRNFAKWLKAIYQTIQRSENYAELTDDVREVFDRMLAAEDDIAHMERVNGYFAKLPDVITENISDATREKVEDYIEKAREKAVDILTRRSLVNYTKERRKEIKKFKDEIRPMVEDEVSKRPVYACGYDKKDAARFRELRNQQESMGIWTDEDFIDRSFPADTNPVENEVAHLAATVNQKNWTKGLGEVKKDYQRQADEILKPAIDALGKGVGQGVDIVQNQDGTTGRVSNNARWYQEFYAAHKRKPTKTELREMARQIVSGDVNAPQVEGWTPTTAEEAEAMRAEGERLADIERHIAACDEIKEKLKKVNENYSETSAAGSEQFLFQAELTAERYGYSSADEMMQDIEKSPTKAEAVKQRINERVQELTMQDERNNYEAMIRESLYNEDEALLIGVEQQLIEEYAAKAKERQEANEQKAEERAEQRKVNAEVAAARKQQAKNAAQADLAKMNVKEATRTSKFITAERNAAMKCAKLLAQKKFDEALAQKNLQAYWHAMVSESMKIQRRQKQHEKFLKRQVSLKREAWLNETHFAAVSQLFTRMNIARPVHREAAEQSQFENLGAYAAAMEEQFDCVDIAPWILEGSIPISDTNALTLEQYEDVVNAVKNIKAIVKAQKGVNTFNKQETWENTKALMMEKLSELRTIWTPNPNKPTKATAMERFTASMETLDSFLEYLDDATYGWFSQTWGNTIKRASDKEYEYREAYDKADADALKKWLPDDAAEKAANAEVYYDELGNSVTKHTLVKMLINLGNKENSQRLCETVPVGFEQSRLWVMPDEFTDRQTAAEQTRQNLINFLGRVLTKEDVEYAQRKIDAAEMFWGEKNDLERRVKGFGLKKVEATPVELTINGETVVLRGGYFPLMRNGETGSHAASAEVNDDDPPQGKRIRTYHTNTSATKARTNARYPVNLFPGAETQWIYESIHDLCWRETMNDFRRVLNDQELFSMMKSKIGAARMQVFKEMLEVCADPRNSKSFSEGEKMIGEAASWLRRKTSHAVIMWNNKVIAQNYANALLYGNAIEGYTMADNLNALGTYFIKYHMPESHKEMVDFVFSKSTFMRERSAVPDITLRDIVDDNKELAWTKFFRETGIKAMAMTDNATAIPNWLTAYNKKLNAGATEQEAIDYADALVRRVLGSSRITDVASMQRGNEITKLLTMFQSFFNARFNEFLRMERLASKQWTKGQKMEAFANVSSYVVSKWLGQTMLAMALALQNPFGIDDEDKWPELIKELKSYSFSMLGPAGQIGNAVAGSFAGMHEYTYRMSAIESTVEKIRRVGIQLHSDKTTKQDKIEAAVDTTTMMFDVPLQLNRIFWNGVDILFNGMDPEIGDIMRRRPKKERK